jgi:hypothetical protein
MDRWFSQASGIIINMAWGRERPPRCRSSSTSSKATVSLVPGVQMGNTRDRSPSIVSVLSRASRARIQFRFPWTVLISPLWAM